MRQRTGLIVLRTHDYLLCVKTKRVRGRRKRVKLIKIYRIKNKI